MAGRGSKDSRSSSVRPCKWRSRDKQTVRYPSYRPDDRRLGFLFSEWAIILLSETSKPTLGPAKPSVQWVAGVLSQEVKRPGRGTDQTSPPSAVVKNAWKYTSTPPRDTVPCTGPSLFYLSPNATQWGLKNSITQHSDLDFSTHVPNSEDSQFGCWKRDYISGEIIRNLLQSSHTTIRILSQNV